MNTKDRKTLATIIMIVFGLFILYCTFALLHCLFFDLGVFSDLLKTCVYVPLLIGVVIIVALSPLALIYGIGRWAVAAIKGQKL
ncbi:MAG: hypothetical protein NTZ49_01690 [Candidatus Parcubacteria bacterium]|nr:hypothetical protein [Candidatus Parcubacteria bacterium]